MDKEKIGIFVHELRKEKQMTQKEMADKLGITDKAVSKWERGLSYPDISMLEPIAKLLDVSVMELLQGQRIENESFIKDHEKQYFERSQSLPANVYITVGGDENKQMTQNAETFLNVLKERNYEGLTIDYEVIDGFDHNTVFKPSIKNAMLRFYGK